MYIPAQILGWNLKVPLSCRLISEVTDEVKKVVIVIQRSQRSLWISGRDNRKLKKVIRLPAF